MHSSLAPVSRLQLAIWFIGLIAAAGSSYASQNVGGYTYATDSLAQSQYACQEAKQDGRETSPLWGCSGESWVRGGLLEDWSFAGYGAGMEAIPSPPVTVDVKKDFHATGSGVTDDTAAVKAAIEATKDTGGVIYFPPGKYILSDQLLLNSYQVLRGAGRDHTTLRFNRALADLRGWGQNYTAGRGRSKFTWAGGMITNQQQRGVFAAKTNLHLGQVVQPARRGDTRLYVGHLVRNSSNAEELFQPGQWYTVALAENTQGDVARMLYNNKTAGGYSLRNFARQFMITHMTRVTAVGPDWIELERPLHVDISLSHITVVAKTANYKVTGIGVEDLEVSFPWTAYMGHHEEAGYNAIEFIGAINSWVRRIRIVNADSGVRLYGSLFNTISDVEIGTAPWSRKGGRWVGRESVWQLAEMDGHMGIALHWASHDNLVEKFNITGTYHHDLLVAVYSSHNVFSQGRGVDICMDHHGAAPNNNLWTDIDVGLGQGAMRWSGDAGANPYAGKLNTFWSIWASKLPVKVDYVGQLMTAARTSQQTLQRGARLSMMARPADIQGYQQVVVDMPLDDSMPTIREAGDWHIQYDPDHKVWPSNLHKAMVSSASNRLRLSTNGTFLADVYPRPKSASAWKPVPVGHLSGAAPGVSAQPAGLATRDADCLNLGCDSSTAAVTAAAATTVRGSTAKKNVSWVHNEPTPAADRLDRLIASSKAFVWALPGSDEVLDLTSSVLETSSSWLAAASKVTASLGGFGSNAAATAAAAAVTTSNISSVQQKQNRNQTALSSLVPTSGIATHLIQSLRQVVSVANNLLMTLVGSFPDADQASGKAVRLPAAVAAVAAAKVKKNVTAVGRSHTVVVAAGGGGGGGGGAVSQKPHNHTGGADAAPLPVAVTAVAAAPNATRPVAASMPAPQPTYNSLQASTAAPAPAAPAAPAPAPAPAVALHDSKPEDRTTQSVEAGGSVNRVASARSMWLCSSCM